MCLRVYAVIPFGCKKILFHASIFASNHNRISSSPNTAHEDLPVPPPSFERTNEQFFLVF